MMKKASLTGVCLYTAGALAQGACRDILVPRNPAPVVASGWQAQLVAGGLTKPRSIQFDSTGALLVVESGKGISRHRFTDNGGTCLHANHSHMLVELQDLNHGLALSNGGDILYASTAESVFAWSYNARNAAVTSLPQTLVTNMSNNDLVTRTLLISEKVKGKLIVSRGSAEANRDRAAVLSSGLSQIRVFDITNRSASESPYNFNTDGDVLGWGLRNSVGVAEHPKTGGIYAVENSEDGVTRNGQDIRENNPGEELNFFGFLDEAVNANASAINNYGYPHCFAVWDPSEIPNGDGLGVGKQFAVEEDNSLTDETCESDYVAPRLTFPAHYAPIDLKFSDGGETGYITFRGSFDRSSPVGYKVASIAFNSATGEPLASADSKAALRDIMTNVDNTQCPDKCFRPVGLAIDSKGRIWFSSDSTGEIYVLQRTGENSEGKFVLPEGGPTGDGSGNNNGNGNSAASTMLGWETRMLSWTALVGLGTWLVL
ncbi:soluble quino protein glucose/sorbosone dehydrogenase [Triangularia verruculosa]|uniref:Soluble quino protein glucose/sorbosone dehydrogenase n=1 Tax=Triangularia verruculosa TaxID=2587418 RepID=A0AAN6XKC6_9PEZI|nr:soluble quino protein glucose/sorbosone dehydrogenase [Triangularia verruculosa]